MTGIQYGDEIISSLCNTVVASEDAVAFAGVLRELKTPASFVSRLIVWLLHDSSMDFIKAITFLCSELWKNFVP